MRRHVHAHTYTPSQVLTLTLPDATGQYAVLQLWSCRCGQGMDLASDITQEGRLLPYAEAMGQYDGEQRRKRTRTIIK